MYNMDDNKKSTIPYIIDTFAESDIVAEAQTVFNFSVPQAEEPNTYKVLSLFSGCGGMDLGFEGHFIANKKSFKERCDMIQKVLNDSWVLLKKITSQQSLQMIFCQKQRKLGLFICKDLVIRQKPTIKQALLI